MDRLLDRVNMFFLSRRGLAFSLSICLLVLSVFFFQMYRKAYRVQGYDFTSYLLSSRALFTGENPYQTTSPFPYIYPLFLCLVLFPLASLPYWFSNGAWFALNVFGLFVSTLVLLKMYLESLSYKEIIAVFVVPFLIFINVIQNNLLNGQVNFIVLALCVLFFKYFLESSKLLASFLLSIAISIKLTPLILIIYLIARKELLYAGLTFAFSALLIFGLPYAVAGEKTVIWYSQYIQSFLAKHIGTASGTSEGLGFSITSIVRFLFPSMSGLLSFLLAGLISVLPIVWVQLASRRNVTSEQILLFSLYMLAVPLISPMSEKHHLINLFPAASIVCVAMLFCSKSHWRIGILTLTTVLVSLIIGKSNRPAAIIAVIALYVSVLCLFLNRNQRVAAHKERTYDRS